MIIYDLIFDLLKNAGISPFAPGAHEGECINPYVVVKETNGTQFNTYSTQVMYYDLMCYAKTYSSCLRLKEQVKQVMLNAAPHVKPTYNELEAYYDETVKGWMVSVEYRNYRKL